MFQLQVCSLWMPVTPVEAKSGLKFIRGSHKWGKWFTPRMFETNTDYIAETEIRGQKYETMPLIKEGDHEILSWDMEVFFFSLASFLLIFISFILNSVGYFLPVDQPRTNFPHVGYTE